MAPLFFKVLTTRLTSILKPINEAFLGEARASSPLKPTALDAFAKMPTLAELGQSPVSLADVPRTQLLQGLSKEAFATELATERALALKTATTPEAKLAIEARFDTAQTQGGFYSPVTGKIAFERTPTTALKRAIASEAIVDTMPEAHLGLLVDHLSAVGVASDPATVAQVIAKWNAAGDDVLTHISSITKSNPEEAGLLRHTNRALAAKVDDTGTPVRRGGLPLADQLGVRLTRLKPTQLDALLTDRPLLRLAPKPRDAFDTSVPRATLEQTPRVSMSKTESHAYFSGLLKENWQFFKDTVNEDSNHLPVDNIKKNGEKFDVDYRTSPTNIGLYMLCVVAAKKMGYITEAEQLDRLHKTTNSVKALLAQEAPTSADAHHLYNWYAINGMTRKMGSFVSSVDNGNFAASLIAVGEAVKKTDPTLAKELSGLTDDMSMAFFHEPKEGLLRHGAEVKRGVAYNTKGTYNLVMTEGRLAVLAGTLKKQIPGDTLFNMKPKLNAEFKAGEIELDPEMKMQSWTGTVFEARLPSMFVETAGTPHGAADEQVLQIHMNDTTGKVWGRSEAMADPVNGGTYAAYGSTDAMSKDYSKDTFKADVFAPYASLMLSDLAPGEVVQNMRNFEAHGARGKYGMYESVAFDPAGKPMLTERFYSHHKAMEMLGIMREVGDFVPELMHGSDLNQGKVIEKMLSTPVSKYRKPETVHGASRVQTPQGAYEADASYNLKDVVGNGPLVAHVASPVGSSLWMNPNYTLSRSDAFVLKDNKTGKILPFDQSAPTRVIDADNARTFEYRVPAEGGHLTVSLEVSTPSSQTKVSKVSVKNETGRPQSLNLTGFTRPMLDDPNAVIAHPGFRDLFVKTTLHESGAIVARRRTVPGAKQESQPYFAFSILGKDGAKVDWADGDRANFMGRNGVASDPAAVKTGASHQGRFGFTQNPGAAISKSIEVPAGQTDSLSFVSAYTSDPNQIATLVGRGDGKAPAAGQGIAQAAAIQFPPDSTHELMQGFAVQEAANRSVRKTSAVGPKVPVAELGEFKNGGRTFRVKNSLSLPRAWSAVLTNGLGANGIEEATFGSSATLGGAGYSFGGTKAHGTNAQRMRMTEWDPDNITETPRAGVVLKDAKTGESWSIAANPATGANAEYPVEVSPGAVTYLHDDKAGLKTSMTKFVAPDDPTELWNIELKNDGKEAREIDVQSFMRVAMGQRFPRTDFETSTAFDAQRGALFSENNDSLKYGSVAFHSVVGDGTHGEQNSLFRTDENPFSGLTSRVTIAPGETKRVSFTAGMAESRDLAKAVVDKFKTAKETGAAQKIAESRVNNFLDVLQVETPDGELNTVLNHWLPYQTLMTHVQARTGHSQSGGGHGGRDQIQSWRNLLVRGDPAVNAAARKYLLQHAAQQFPEGNMSHWWHPHDALGQNSTISDTALWGPYSTLEYVKKTGDTSILDEQVTYLDGRPLKPGERDYVQNFKPTSYTESVYDHGKKAIDLILDKRMGDHGLPLILGGDWNDALNAVGPLGKGESGWLAFFLHDNLTKFAEVARARNDTATATKYEAAATKLQGNIMKHLWDKERGFFIRGYADDGSKLDFMDVIVQGWAAESRAVEPKYAKQALNAAFDQLYTEKTNSIGLLAANLGEEQWDGTVKNAPKWAGAAAEYPPDVRETGQYTHGAAFAMSGLTKVGMGDLALKAIRTALPNVHALREGYDAEPYALAADIQTKTGKAGWTHYSGASGWVMRSAVEGLLGIEFRDGNKLFIDPCLPTGWDKYSATHKRGAATYRIEVTNPEHISKGVKAVEVDGVAMDLATYRKQGVSMVDDGKPHVVKVLMGATGEVSVAAKKPSAPKDWI